MPENRDELRQRKIDGLLKLIQEKNSQIESLKNELNEYKQSETFNRFPSRASLRRT